MTDDKCQRLMPKENGRKVTCKERSEEEMWSCQGDGGGEEMLQLRGTQGENNGEALQSDSESKAGEKKKREWKDEKLLKEEGK